MARYSWMLAFVPGDMIQAYLAFFPAVPPLDAILRVASAVMMLIGLVLLVRYMIRSGQA